MYNRYKAIKRDKMVNNVQKCITNDKLVRMPILPIVVRHIHTFNLECINFHMVVAFVCKPRLCWILLTSIYFSSKCKSTLLKFITVHPIAVIHQNSHNKSIHMHCELIWVKHERSCISSTQTIWTHIPWPIYWLVNAPIVFDLFCVLSKVRFGNNINFNMTQIPWIFLYFFCTNLNKLRCNVFICK